MYLTVSLEETSLAGWNLQGSLKGVTSKNGTTQLLLVFVSTDALMDYTNGELIVVGENATANIFASYPAKHLSILNGFVDQVSLQAGLKRFTNAHK